MAPGRAWFFLGLLLALAEISCGRSTASQPTEIEPGVAYQNDRIMDVPWSVHIAKVDRARGNVEFVSTHAKGTVLGLGTLSEQIKAIAPTAGRPLAGVNGDFYQREGSQYYGDPRGLQIVEGEMFSGPNGGVCFWTDRDGHPHATNVTARFTVTWPDGTTTPYGLNEMRRPSNAVLFTPTLGPATRTSGGRELVLESDGQGPWLPLRPGQTYVARVKEVRDSGNTPLRPGVMVLSLGPQLAKGAPQVQSGAVLKLSTATFPDVTGARAAIGGGPLLVHNGRRMEIPKPAAGSIGGYEFRSMGERHPRAAVGWNKSNFFLVEVDGRQAGLSLGMKLAELAEYMVKLSCEEAMNLDGGGSATFWMAGKVRNSPCDGYERPLANALVLVRKDKASAER